MDPNGDDNYFNAEGKFLGRTKGNNIRVITDKGNKFLSEIPVNNAMNIKLLVNIVKHYSYPAGIRFPTFVGISPSTPNRTDATTNETTNKPSLAATNKDGIMVSAKNGVNSKLNNYNDLISTLFHEKRHVDNETYKKESNFTTHVNIYDDQISDKTFKPTSEGFKLSLVSNFVSYLLGALDAGKIDDYDFDKRINTMNTKLKSFGITISSSRELGSGALKPIHLFFKGPNGKLSKTKDEIKAQKTPN